MDERGDEVESMNRVYAAWRAECCKADIEIDESINKKYCKSSRKYAQEHKEQAREHAREYRKTHYKQYKQYQKAWREQRKKAAP